jgi:N-dimethylarginine dimethylaminohydrolase
VKPLGWGRHYLMCPPDHFGVLYEINPWMHTDVWVDPDLAAVEWNGLVATLREAGAAVDFELPVVGLPDLVFTANAGVLCGRRFVPSHFRHPERQGESAVDAAYFAGIGYEVVELSGDLRHEGAGDALPFGGVLISGYRTRSDYASHAALGELLGVAVRSVELVDPRLYHLDLVFCPLDDRRALVAPLGLDTYGIRVITELVPEPVLLSDEEALSFCANSVVVGTTIVMPHCPPRLGRLLESFGFDVVTSQVDEFQKAGGGARCLTLALDVCFDDDHVTKGGGG